MTSQTSSEQQKWYYDTIKSLSCPAVSVDTETNYITYSGGIRSDESLVKKVKPEELVRATVTGLLCSSDYNYPPESIGCEMRFAHGSRGSMSDKIDIIVYDGDGLPFALFELKPNDNYEKDKDEAIKSQLFGTAPLTGAPRLLVYASVEPNGSAPSLKSICIDYTRHNNFDAWREAGEPHSNSFPKEYRELDYKPITNQGDNPLNLNGTLSEFKSIAAAFHSEFFGEHPDNIIFVNLVKCLLAKILDERTTENGQEYKFQVFQRAGKPETAKQVFERINGLYKSAYTRYVASGVPEDDEISTREFSEERVKTVVQALQRLSITMGAARNGDIIGAFFEEILRAGFKQDRGMYFTHDNLARFMVEAVGLKSLTEKTWRSSTHPENRLPYIIDPACGSGTFLLHSMEKVTNTLRNSASTMAADPESEDFFNSQMGDDRPNRWAERFIYGFDPKFIMAITAKVNMVLHGDGSAHILKQDAFSPFASYTDTRLRRCNEDQRSIPKTRYHPDMCENFDLVMSNPPFGVTLAAETRAKINDSFILPESTPSEGLFIERCFQLLKPGGRLAVVLPESLLNGKELMDVRIFLYRMFTIKSIVSMPRNLFIDTPTKTSILIAQKKTPQEIELWDRKWEIATRTFDECVATAKNALSKRYYKDHSAKEIAAAFTSAISPVVPEKSWVIKGGSDPKLMRITRDWTEVDGAEAASHYRSILRTADFRRIRDQYTLKSVATDSYEFPVFEVEAVGYKLSKRAERQRPNQLLRMRGRTTNREIYNLHIADEECDVITDPDHPLTVLDEIMAEVSWS